MTDSDLVSTGFVAAHVGCSPSFLKDAEREGKLPPTQRLIGVGREWRAWPASALPELERQVSELLRGTGRRKDRATTVREEVAPTA